MGSGGGAALGLPATRMLASAARSVAQLAARAGRLTGRTIHRLTHASGAGRTGLANLIELSAAGAAGDAFVTVALAGTLFFSTSLDQARGRVALALLVTMAPFAVLAPLIGPMLDRVQQGRRFLLAGTLLGRGLLCWGMAGAVQTNDAITLLPAAFGVLVLQKAYGVTRSSVTPRLLPGEITLVTANARMSMASLVSSGAALVAAGAIDLLAGGGAGGAAWSLRVGTVVYLAATGLGFRVPEQVDFPGQPPAAEQAGHVTGARAPALAGTDTPRRRPPGAPPPGTAVPRQVAPLEVTPLPTAVAESLGTARGRAGTARASGTAGYHGNAPAGTWPGGRTGRGGTGRGGTRRAGGSAGRRGPAPGPGGDGAAGPNGRGRWRTLRRVGPVVGEAMRVNATLRAFSGFMVLFLAFLLRMDHFPGVSDKVALGAMIAAAGAGGFLGTAVGSALRPTRPHLITFGMLAAATVITALCAASFGLWAALVVALIAAFGQVLGKLALDSTVQREIGEEIRTSTFAVSETLHQLSWVAGALAGVAMSFSASGVAGLTVAAVGLATSLMMLLARRRRRIMAAQRG